MRLDFWNNPIVVSAFRVKYRRSGPFAITSLYVVAILIAWSLLQHYQSELIYPWLRIFFVGLISAQFAISAALAVTATSTSMNQEVANRTLDLQRIAALSPTQILLGKLLGEPAIAYLLAMTTIPFAVICGLLGVASPAVIVLLYVNVVTTTLLLGSLGLITKLDAPERTQGGIGCGMGTIVVLVLVQLMVNLRFMLTSPWSEALVGLITPIPILYGVFNGLPWERGLALFGAKIPFLLVTPIAQSLLATLCFKIMTRRLVNPLETSFSKPFAYVVLLTTDLLAAAMLYDPTSIILAPTRLAAAFCLVHLLASGLLVFAITPSRESLWSWFWRFRGRLPKLVDLVRGERSENVAALFIFAALGIVSLVGFVIVPAAARNLQAYRNELPTIAAVAGATVLLLFSLGTLKQWLALIAGRGGFSFFVVLATMVALPHALGEYYKLDWLQSLSPSPHFARWLSGSTPLPLLPLVAVYGPLFMAARMGVSRRLSAQIALVEEKLRRMQAEAAASGSRPPESINTMAHAPGSSSNANQVPPVGLEPTTL